MLRLLATSCLLGVAACASSKGTVNGEVVALPELGTGSPAALRLRISEFMAAPGSRTRAALTEELRRAVFMVPAQFPAEAQRDGSEIVLHPGAMVKSVAIELDAQSLLPVFTHEAATQPLRPLFGAFELHLMPGSAAFLLASRDFDGIVIDGGDRKTRLILDRPAVAMLAKGEAGSLDETMLAFGARLELRVFETVATLVQGMRFKLLSKVAPRRVETVAVQQRLRDAVAYVVAGPDSERLTHLYEEILGGTLVVLWLGKQAPQLTESGALARGVELKIASTDGPRGKRALLVAVDTESLLAVAPGATQALTLVGAQVLELVNDLDGLLVLSNGNQAFIPREHVAAMLEAHASRVPVRIPRAD